MCRLSRTQRLRSSGVGTWTLTAGISQLFLGDNTRAFNRGDDTLTIAVIGLQASF
ncbi:MAG: hypothetical protein ACK5ZG_05035 [Phycisphaerae bacterium]